MSRKLKTEAERMGIHGKRMKLTDPKDLPDGFVWARGLFRDNKDYKTIACAADREAIRSVTIEIGPDRSNLFVHAEESKRFLDGWKNPQKGPEQTEIPSFPESSDLQSKLLSEQEKIRNAICRLVVDFREITRLNRLALRQLGVLEEEAPTHG